jgi:replicative DNA helicase
MRLSAHFDLEAEMGVLGSMILSPSAARDAVSIGSAEWFWRPSHALLFSAIERLVSAAKAVDFVTVKDSLGASLLDAGGEDYLVQIAEFVPTPGNWRFYLQIVEDKHRLRMLEALADNIREVANEPEGSVPEKLTAVSHMAMEATAVLPTTRSLAQAVRDVVSQVDRVQETGKPEIGLSTGLVDLDQQIGGLEASRLYIVGARPSVGKSALGLKLVTAGCRAGRTLMFSMEMSDEQLIRRLIAMRTGITTRQQKEPMTQEVYQTFMEAADWANSLPLVIDDRAGLTVNQVRARCMKEREKEPLSLIVVDYVQLMQSTKRNGSRQQDIGEITRGLKALTKELATPVVALAQLGRDAENARPSLKDFREAGDIENDADVCLLLHRSGKREEWNQTADTIVECIVAKSRDDMNGTVLLGYDGNRVLFLNAGYEVQREYWSAMKREQEAEKQTRRRAA